MNKTRQIHDTLKQNMSNTMCQDNISISWQPDLVMEEVSRHCGNLKASVNSVRSGSCGACR